MTRPVTRRLCPRCRAVALPACGALSRTDNRTEVCPACGVDEAMRQFRGDPLPPRDQWPTAIQYRLPEARP